MDNFFFNSFSAEEFTEYSTDLLTSLDDLLYHPDRHLDSDVEYESSDSESGNESDEGLDGDEEDSEAASENGSNDDENGDLESDDEFAQPDVEEIGEMDKRSATSKLKRRQSFRIPPTSEDDVQEDDSITVEPDPEQIEEEEEVPPQLASEALLIINQQIETAESEYLSYEDILAECKTTVSKRIRCIMVKLAKFKKYNSDLGVYYRKLAGLTLKKVSRAIVLYELFYNWIRSDKEKEEFQKYSLDSLNWKQNRKNVEDSLSKFGIWLTHEYPARIGVNRFRRYGKGSSKMIEGGKFATMENVTASGIVHCLIAGVSQFMLTLIIIKKNFVSVSAS